MKLVARKTDLVPLSFFSLLKHWQMPDTLQIHLNHILPNLNPDPLIS
jgi:hypothetical protein